MESFVEKYWNYEEINSFMTFEKKSINWLCLINNNLNKNCPVHKSLIHSERLPKNKIDEKKVGIF